MTNVLLVTHPIKEKMFSTRLPESVESSIEEIPENRKCGINTRRNCKESARLQPKRPNEGSRIREIKPLLLPSSIGPALECEPT